MGQLDRKHAAPLLRVVRNQPYASSNDHHDDEPRMTRKGTDKRRTSRRTKAESSMPTPPGTNSSFASQKEPEPETIDLENEEDIFADPISSDDEMAVSNNAAANSDGFKTLNVDQDTSEEMKAKESSFKPLVDEGGGASSKGKEDEPGSGEKRKFKYMDTELEAGVDTDPDWMADFKKKRRNGKSGNLPNIHAGPGLTLSQQKIKKDYTKGCAARARVQAQQKTTNGFQHLKGASPKKKPEQSTFKLLDLDIGPDTGSDIKADGDLTWAKLGSSSSLSSAQSTPEPDEVQILDLPDPKPYRPVVECSYCGKEVNKLIFEEFEDRYKTGQDSSFKWKRRFCKFHQQQEAQVTWQERSYPTIEWTNLERRMRRHDPYLRDVLYDRTPSYYRQTLKDRVKPGTNSLKQALKDVLDVKGKEGRKTGGSVGYYGPKGERIMMDHIINCLSDDIRKQAKNDKLVAASGIQGGVSGFVQAVLVPHLAELLIKEDLKLTGDWSVKARETIAESCEVGEILHPEAKDNVVEIADDSDDD